MSEDYNNYREETNNSTEYEEEQQEEVRLKKTRYLIEIRRAKVLELWSKGWSQYRIAQELNVSQTLIFLDIQWIRETSRAQLKTFITERLPTAIAKTCTSLDIITQKAWETVANAERDRDEKTKLQALNLIKETEADKLEVVSNVNIVD